MMLRAWRFSANVYGEDRDEMQTFLQHSDAFKEPKYGQLKIIDQT
jgi:hypothetical protein